MIKSHPPFICGKALFCPEASPLCCKPDLILSHHKQNTVIYTLRFIVCDRTQRLLEQHNETENCKIWDKFDTFSVTSLTTSGVLCFNILTFTIIQQQNAVAEKLSNQFLVNLIERNYGARKIRHHIFLNYVTAYIQHSSLAWRVQSQAKYTASHFFLTNHGSYLRTFQCGSHRDLNINTAEKCHVYVTGQDSSALERNMLHKLANKRFSHDSFTVSIWCVPDNS